MAANQNPSRKLASPSSSAVADASPSKTVKLVVFDLDNTLIDTKSANKIAYNSVIYVLAASELATLSEARSVARSVESALSKKSVSEDLTEIYEMWDKYILTPNNTRIYDWYKTDIAVHLFRAGQWYLALKTNIDDKKYEARRNRMSDIERSDYSLRKLALKCYNAFTESRYRAIAERGLSPSTVNMFKLLAKKPDLKIGILTNGSAVIQWPKIEACKVEQYVDFVYVSSEVSQKKFGRITAKPDPQLFKYVARQHCVSPSQCIMIGDSMREDIIGAIAAGYARALFVTDDAKCMTDDKYVFTQEPGSKISVTLRACMPEYVLEWL